MNWKTIVKSMKNRDMQKRVFGVVGLLVIFRFLAHVPIPLANAGNLKEVVESAIKSTDLGGFINLLTGGALTSFSIMLVGLSPFITASIITQLMTKAIPSLEELNNDGESGRRKISKYTRYSTVVLATLQAVGISTGLPNMLPGLVPNLGFGFYFTAVISLVTGTMFLMWLGEQITERGIGNGISLIIFAGIVAGLPATIGQTIEETRQGDISFLVLLLIAIIAFAVTYFVVFVERGQRRIVVNYASRQQGRMMAPARSSHLPLKVNMAGVIPAIFASSIIVFPASVTQWFGQSSEGFEWLFDLSQLLQPGQPLYIVLFTMAVIFFAFFYTGMQYNPRDTADNLKKSGAFVPGYRPGEQTSRYIDKVMTRLTLIGALYIAFVCLVPYIITSLWKVPFQLGGTSLLIVVVVIMDFIAQVQSHMMSLQYDSVLKKANLKGLGQ